MFVPPTQSREGMLTPVDQRDHHRHGVHEFWPGARPGKIVDAKPLQSRDLAQAIASALNVNKKVGADWQP